MRDAVNNTFDKNSDIILMDIMYIGKKGSFVPKEESPC